MPVTRRSTIAFFLAATLPVKAFASEAYVPPLTDDERLTIATMLDRGVSSFLMLNEKQGLMKLIRDGRVYLVSPAASGAVKGDDANRNPRVTPAGVFPLTDYGDDKYIEYYALGRSAYLIHPTTPRRDSLLEGGNPDRFRASEGCIAVPRPVFDRILNFLRRDGGRILVVLPEEQNIRLTLGLGAAPAP